MRSKYLLKFKKLPQEKIPAQSMQAGIWSWVKKINSLFFLTLLSQTSIAQGADVTLRFNAPATTFTESLPLGNGRLGALLYGNTQQERIALNEISL